MIAVNGARYSPVAIGLPAASRTSWVDGAGLPPLVKNSGASNVPSIRRAIRGSADATLVSAVKSRLAPSVPISASAAVRASSRSARTEVRDAVVKSHAVTRSAFAIPWASSAAKIAG